MTEPRDGQDEGLQIEGAHGMAVRIDGGAAVLRRLLGENG